jgi:hypothetical protein
METLLLLATFSLPLGYEKVQKSGQTFRAGKACCILPGFGTCKQPMKE